VGGPADGWDENFSDRLRVAEVRAVVFRTAGARGTPAPVPFRAVGILGGPRCVAEPDRVVVLARCRAAPDAQAVVVDATPTYRVGQPRDRLTWVVELDQTPLLGEGEALGIEFVLRAMP
jgi:hypothetical protein